MKTTWKRIITVILPCCISFVLVLLLIILLPDAAYADTFSEKKIDIKNYRIVADGEYMNWEGVSNVSQFADANGNYCFAYVKPKSIVIVKTKNGEIQENNIILKKKYPIFGGVVCDKDGYYYLVSGRENKTNNRKKNTVFVSKYDKNGNLIKTFGCYGDDYLKLNQTNTKIPFHAGNCAIAVNGKYLIVHYGKKQYNGHQSSTAFVLDTSTMERVEIGPVRASHSFAQRAIPFGEGFVLAEEGDSFPRAFHIYTITDMPDYAQEDWNIFHFWPDSEKSSGNNNFAHMGGLAYGGEGIVALAGTSAKSLSQKAASENEQLFIQIFYASQDLDTADNFLTTGIRSGFYNERQVTDYGVKWLTKYSKKYEIKHPQLAAVEGKFVLLYELFKNGYYKGIYYIVLDKNGKIIKNVTRCSKTAYLNPCETPVCCGDTIYWNGNKDITDSNGIYVGVNMYLNSLKID